MKIALDYSSAASPQPSGIGRYARQLSRCLERLAPNGQIQYLIKANQWRHRGHLPYWVRPKVGWYETSLWKPLGHLDLLHGLDGRLPPLLGRPGVVTFHDLAPFRLSLEGITSNRFLFKKFKDYTESLRRADLVLAVSQTTARDLEELFKVPRSRIRVTPLGVESRFKPTSDEQVLKRHGLDGLAGSYLFYLGGLSRRKNLTRLIQAYGRSQVGRQLPLVLAGSLSFGNQEILDQLVELPPTHRVLLIGSVPEADLPALYSQAAGFLFPTLYEGFGLPILKAMACGTPVLTSTTGSAPEVAGGHALLADPYDLGSLSAAIEDLPYLSPEERQAARGHARSFTWEQTARRTVRAYSEVLAQGAMQTA